MLMSNAKGHCPLAIDINMYELNFPFQGLPVRICATHSYVSHFKWDVCEHARHQNTDTDLVSFVVASVPDRSSKPRHSAGNIVQCLPVENGYGECFGLTAYFVGQCSGLVACLLVGASA